MANVTATDAPIYFAAHDAEDVVVSGLLPTTGAVATPLSLVHAESETAFVAAAVGLADSYNPLPDSGTLTAGEIYGYGGGLVIVRQTHQRTEHAPEDVPALFCVYREDAPDTLEWVAGESVLVGTTRTHEGVTYRAIQAHVTQANWTPDSTPALWQVVEDEPQVGAWQAGTAYAVNDEVTYSGVTYRCLQAHTALTGWEPPNVPALWQQV